MRRALLRCSSSLPRNFSVLSISNTRTARHCLRRIDSSSHSVTPSLDITRSIHQSLKRQQEAVAATEEIVAGSDAPITRFKELETNNILHRNVVGTLTRDMGLETMTDVQSATINEAIKGNDVIAQAKTGTGKTLAFLIPILQRIINADPHLAERSGGRRGPRTTADDIRAIIISPTRELAEQIAEEARKLTRNTSVVVQAAVGGTQKSAGLRAIQNQGCHLLVGTPGRLKDILTDRYSRVEAPDLSAFVLDEADRLLDQGFWPDIQEIMRLLPTPQEKDRQTMMFSATVPREVVRIVRDTLKPGFQFVRCVRDDEQQTHERIPQKIVNINGMENSLPTLIEICQNGVQAAREPNGKPFKAIVYFNSTAEVTLATSVLQSLQVPATADAPDGDAFGRRNLAHPFGNAKILEIHAKLTQSQRTRAAQDFRNCQSGILLSSDVTARGMDFPNVTHVLQMGLPSSQEQYIHRIGRTGRAGKEGEGWLVLNAMESYEARSRLRGMPLQPDASLSIPKLDLTKAGDVPVSAGRILGMYQKAIRAVPMAEKAKVYLAQLGVHAFVSRKHELVRAMNNLSQYGWGLKEPPNVSPGLAQRLRLTGIEGLRLGSDFDGSGPPRGGGFGGNSSGGRNSRFGDREDRFGGRGGSGRDYDRGRSSYGGPRQGNGSGRSSRYADAFS